MYARNALFSGLFPIEIAERYPDYWQEESDGDTSTNRYERQLLEAHLKRRGVKLKPGVQYFKIFDTRGGNTYKKRVAANARVSLSALVINFIDILTHQRSQSDVLQQLAPDESAFRVFGALLVLAFGTFRYFTYYCGTKRNCSPHQRSRLCLL